MFRKSRRQKSSKNSSTLLKIIFLSFKTIKGQNKRGIFWETEILIYCKVSNSFFFGKKFQKNFILDNICIYLNLEETRNKILSQFKKERERKRFMTNLATSLEKKYDCFSKNSGKIVEHKKKKEKKKVKFGLKSFSLEAQKSL